MPRKKAGAFYFDKEAADRICNFFEKVLVHVKGEWDSQPFLLEKWQKKHLRDLFGWKRADGTRKYRRCFWTVAKKNGKSAIGSGIAIYLTCADGEPGAEVFSAAADKPQAAIVFNTARQMVERSAELSKRLATFRYSIVHHESASFYRVLSSDAKTKHGLNVHGCIFDELHTQPNRELWDTLVAGGSARRQPMVIAFTTAGFDKHSIWYEQLEYARKVRDGIIKDDTFLPVIYEAEEGDAWDSVKTWRKSNPNLGVSKKLEYMREECARAKESPAYENTFRRLETNMQTEQSVRWMPMDKWDKCATPVDAEALRGADCFVGMDLASTQDITAVVLVFPCDDGTVDVLPRFFIPEEGMRKRSKRDRVPYEMWVDQGYMFATTGNVTDYAFLRDQLKKDAKQFNIVEVAYDTWNSSQLCTQLMDDNFPMVQFGQGFKAMNAPTKELLKLVLEQKINHGGHPVLRWMASNVSVKSDPAGNLRPDKAKSTEKIDGQVALIMALGRLIVQPDSRSVYEERGVLSL